MSLLRRQECWTNTMLNLKAKSLNVGCCSGKWLEPTRLGDERKAYVERRMPRSREMKNRPGSKPGDVASKVANADE